MNVQMKLGISIAVSALIVLLWGLVPRDVEAFVSGKSWSCAVETERLETVEKDGWSVTEGGRVIRTEPRVYGYEQVPTISWAPDFEGRWRTVVRMRDGDPIYRDWHTWQQEEWRSCRTIAASGGADEDPYQPNDFVLMEGAGEHGVGAERVCDVVWSFNVAMRVAVYRPEKTHEVSVSRDEWHAIRVGDSVVARFAPMLGFWKLRHILKG